jgi:hypothetical protein
MRMAQSWLWKKTTTKPRKAAAWYPFPVLAFYSAKRLGSASKAKDRVGSKSKMGALER